MFNKFLYGAVHFPMNEAAEGGGGSGGGDAAQQGGDKGGQQQAADKGGEGQQQQGTGDSLLDDVESDGEGDKGKDAPIDFSKGRPDWLPQDAWDEAAKQPKADVLAKHLKAAEDRAKGLRDKLAKGLPKPPKDAKEYEFKASDKSKKYVADNDPVVAAAAPIALKYGLSKEQFAGFMGDMADTLAELSEKAQAEGTKEQELTPEEKAEIRTKEYAKIGTNAPQIIRAVESWGREMKAEGFLSEGDLEAFKSMAMNGDQVRVLNKLRARAGGGNALPMDAGGDGLPSDKEIGEMLNKAWSAKDEAEEKRIMDKYMPLRKQAGRPDRLQV